MTTEETPGSGESQDQVGGETRTNRARPDALRDLAGLLVGQSETDEADEDDAAGGGDTDEGNPEADEGGESRNQAEDTGGGESQKPPTTLAEAAERLGLDVTALYKLTVPDPHSEGESFTLGELKDAHAQRGEFTVKQMAWEESRAEQQAELLRAQQEIEELLTHVPKRLLESDALKAARTRLDARGERERRLTLQAIPEWRSEETRKADLAAMIEHLSGYGFPKEYLGSVSDHRTFRYIRENMQREQRVKAALEQVQKLQGKQHKPGKPNAGKPPQKPGSSDKQRSTVQTPQAKRKTLTQLMGPSDKG